MGPGWQDGRPSRVRTSAKCNSKRGKLVFNQQALRLKKRLGAGEYSPGIWISMPSPMACELIAGAGLDWVVVDAEHSPSNPETLLHMLMALRGSQTLPLVRVA